MFSAVGDNDCWLEEAFKRSETLMRTTSEVLGSEQFDEVSTETMVERGLFWGDICWGSTAGSTGLTISFFSPGNLKVIFGSGFGSGKENPISRGSKMAWKKRYHTFFGQSK